MARRIKLMASPPKRRNLGDTNFSEDFDGQPLVKEDRAHKAAQMKFDQTTGERIKFGHAPQDIPKIASKPGAIFSLTGGYVPTFSEEWGNPGYYYKQHAAGMIMHQESLTFNGPQGTFMRGNHVWYNYAKDYEKAIGKVSDLLPGNSSKEKTDNLLTKNSAYNEIMTSYASGVGNWSTSLLTSWRNEIANMMGKKLPEITDEDGRTDMDTVITSEVDRPGQAPEEMIPAILQRMGYDIEVLTNSDDMMQTYGGSKPIDIMFKFGNSYYRVDVTQSRIAHTSTLMSIGTFKSNIDFSKKLGENQLKELQLELTTHYQNSVEQINAMIMDIYNVVSKLYGKSNVEQSFNKLREYVRDMQSQGTGFTRMDAKGEQTGKTGDKLRGADIQNFIDKVMGEFKTTVLNIAGEEIKREALKDAFEHALHILGADFSALSGDGFYDAVLLGKDPNMEFLVKPQFGLTTQDSTVASRVSGGTYTIPQLFLMQVEIQQDHTLFMDWFMEFEMNIDADMRQYIIELANMMWNMDSMHTTLEKIVYGQALVPATLLPTAMGYQVAGGAVSFEASSINEELGAALNELIEETIDKPGSYENAAKKVVQQGYTEGMSFSNVWKTGAGLDDSIFSASYEGFNPNNADLSQMFIRGDENKADDYRGLNRWLRANTWIAPYIGVFYQGGRSQKMEVMGANPK